MYKYFLALFFSVSACIPSYSQDYDRKRPYYSEPLVRHDTVWYCDKTYLRSEFYMLARQRKIKLDNGQMVEDSVFFRHKWLDKSDYYANYYFETAMMPGLEFEYYKPFRSDSLGTWSGISVEYLFYGKVHNDDENGPGHVKFYGKLGILDNSRPNIPIMLNYSLGISLSWEKDPKRTWIVPNFGLESGAFSQKELGTVFYFTPIGGIQFIALQNIFFGAYAGYRYPLTNFENLRGFVATTSVDFSLWK